jgi:hypothetical protein
MTVMVVRGSRSRCAGQARPSEELTMMCSPSVWHQMGTTDGVPSFLIVPTWAKLGASRRARTGGSNGMGSWFSF